MVQKVGSSPSNCVIIDVAFSEKIKHRESGVINKIKVQSEEDRNSFKAAIPANEYVSVREAFLTLSEIFKEERQAKQQ